MQFFFFRKKKTKNNDKETMTAKETDVCKNFNLIITKIK